MHRILEGFPSQLSPPPLPPEVGNLPIPGKLVVVGVGGSAIGGDLFRTYMARVSSCPVHVVRGYRLPRWVDTQTLVVAVSCSGGTAETLTMFQEAKGLKVPMVAVTRGGKLAQAAREEGIPLIKLQGTAPPRTTLGATLAILLALAQSLSLLPPGGNPLEEAQALLSSMARDLRPTSGGGEALELARKLQGSIPLIYAGGPLLESVATRWKGQINENSKTPAFTNTFPELGHNEIVGWEGDMSPFHLILLRDREETDLQRRTIKATVELLKNRCRGLEEVTSRGENLLTRLLSLVYLGDWVSYYLALLKGIDPTPIPLIDELKRRI
jgi:glucose/mannose-6-phosphate isomerase